MFDIIVTASDGTDSTDQSVAITVTDVDEAPPVVVSNLVDITFLTDDEGIILTGDSSGDGVTALSVSAAGDVNGDGFDDFIIGFSLVADGVGQAIVVFGEAEASGLDLSSLTPDQGFSIQSGEAYDLFGDSVSSAGDVNGDGFDDLIISAYYSGGGNAYVVFGGDINSDVDVLNLTPSQGFVIEGDSSSGALGTSVSSAGDVNGDGFDDLIVGDPIIDTNGLNSGEAYVIFGGETNSDVDVSNLTADQGFTILAAASGDVLGQSVSAAGDVNGDGFDDIIVGAPFVDNEGESTTGASYVIFGGSDSNSIDLSNLTPELGFVLEVVQDPDSLTFIGPLGIAVSSAGDVNGDGFDDVIVGANNILISEFITGAAFVVFGDDTASNINVANLTTDQGFAIVSDALGDYAGGSVASAGDVNGDGFDDLIVGAPFGDDGGDDAGEAYVIFGGENITDIELSNLTAAQGFIIQGDVSGDAAGFSVSSAGDVNGDGFDLSLIHI